MNDRVTILGARGSVPVSGEAYRGYGCATTCILVELDGHTLVLDAGTGLMNLPPRVLELPVLPLLLSHPHVDHLLGLPLNPYVMRPGAELKIYGKTRDGLGVHNQIRRLLGPPLWPVGTGPLPAKVSFFPLEDRQTVHGVEVSCLEGVHPGGVSLLRLAAGGKALVLATDCTLSDELLPALTEFARDCDLLLIDGQYAPEEWASRRHFGHSTWTAAAALGQACGAKQTLIIHHDPCRTDDRLDQAQRELAARCPAGCRFAREGEVIAL